FTYSNLQPTAERTGDGALVVAYSSPQPQFNAPTPTLPDTNPQNQLYFTSVAGTPPAPSNPSPLIDLGQFIPVNGNQWFNQAVGPYPGTAPATLNGLFQVTAPNSILSSRFSSPAFPSSGLIDPTGGPNFTFSRIAFLGSAEIQSGGAGRST